MIGDIYNPEDRKKFPELARAWNRLMKELDREILGSDIDDPLPPATPIAPVPAPTPDALPQVKRMSHEEQDAWSDRMRARYGREY